MPVVRGESVYNTLPVSDIMYSRRRQKLFGVDEHISSYGNSVCEGLEPESVSYAILHPVRGVCLRRTDVDNQMDNLRLVQAIAMPLLLSSVKPRYHISHVLVSS
jgi:hypothetical protein